MFLVQDANEIIDDVMNAIDRWSNFADQANLPLEEQKRVQADFRFVSTKSNKLKGMLLK